MRAPFLFQHLAIDYSQLMSAIAGIWVRSGGVNSSGKCARLLREQERFGSIDPSVGTLGPVALGRSLHPSLVQQTSDAQPVTGGDGRFLLVADIRIDNREDLRRALNLSAPERDVTDAMLLMKAWERWGVDTLARLSADFALAVWDEEKQSLTLARDVIGQRPLHYAQAMGPSHLRRCHGRCSFFPRSRRG
jgi:asparagine synthase (glutamine-hydrolysing)